MRAALRACSLGSVILLLAVSTVRTEESLRIVPLIHANRVVVSFELQDAYNDAVREAIASTIVATTDRYENLTRQHTLTRTVDGRVEEALVTEDDAVVKTWLTKWN